MMKAKMAAGGGMMKKGYAAGGMTKKAYAAGGMPMVEKNGQKVPAFAADGKGKMAAGGMAKAKMMAGGGMTKAKMMAGGGATKAKAHSDVKKDKPMMKKVASAAVKGHEKRMHRGRG